MVSVLLLFTLICSFRFTADDMKPTQHWDYDQIKEHAQAVGYRIHTDPETGLDVYRSVLSSSHLLLPHNGSDFDVVVVNIEFINHHTYIIIYSNAIDVIAADSYIIIDRVWCYDE